jgi:hypothetical protein
MEIKNRSHNWQSETKLAKHLHIKLSKGEQDMYARMYAEYNEVHAQVLEIESTITGKMGHHSLVHTVKEVL